jgi:hypothetical protein
MKLVAVSSVIVISFSGSWATSTVRESRSIPIVVVSITRPTCHGFEIAYLVIDELELNSVIPRLFR